MRSSTLVVALFSLALLPHSAHADTLDNISILGSGQDIEFSVPSSATAPLFSYPPAYGFTQLHGTVNGVPTNLNLMILLPFAGVGSDTFTVSQLGSFLELSLPPLYTITDNFLSDTATLTFLPGTYTAYDVAPVTTYPPPFRGPYSIMVTAQATAPTPEPGSLLLLATGTISVAWQLRRRIVQQA